MSGAIGRAVAAAAGFVAGDAFVGVVGIAIAFASRAPGGDSTRALLEQLALTVYFVVVHGALSAIVFAAIAALCRRWRQLGARAAALWGALAGMGGGAMYWIGLADAALKFVGATIGAGPQAGSGPRSGS